MECAGGAAQESARDTRRQGKHMRPRTTRKDTQSRPGCTRWRACVYMYHALLCLYVCMYVLIRVYLFTGRWAA